MIKVEKIPDELKKMEKENLKTFYKEAYIKTMPKGSRKIYSDVIIGCLIKNNIKELFNEFEEIGKITRDNDTYKKEHKVDEIQDIPSQWSKEKLTAKKLKHKKLNFIGEIIDFETPIKNPWKKNKEENKEENKEKNKGVGKIDLLAYYDNNDKKFLSLIEFKYKTNKEPLIRAILEICTYYCQINRDKLKTDFGYEKTVDVHKVVLVYKDSEQYNDYINSKDNFNSLIKELDVKICFFDGNEIVETI